jgi:hypothetical protein
MCSLSGCGNMDAAAKEAAEKDKDKEDPALSKES